MTDLSVSVIIVSRDRPQALLHCLTGVRQLIYPNFEVVVIADSSGIDALNRSEFRGKIKTRLFEQPNISAARNEGLSQAAGEIVAFIDDDAVPEPGWLIHLIAPFEDETIDAAGGYVRGRNGISYQWKASGTDSLGYETDLKLVGDSIAVLKGSSDRAIKTQGTNCAFRKQTLMEMGGFDTAFHFFLDETDVNMRLAVAGCKTAIVPRAEVHHGYLGSQRRSNNRMPVSLFDVGASTVVFLRKHAAKQRHEKRLSNLVSEQKKALLEHMVKGNCEPGEIDMVLLTLHAGIKEGTHRQIENPQKIDPSSAPFLPFCSSNPAPEHKIIEGFRLDSEKLHQKARRSADSGNITSLYVFSRTALFHRTFFHKDGYWVQTGGLLGKSERSEKLMSWNTMDEKVKKEMTRVAQARFPANRLVN